MVHKRSRVHPDPVGVDVNPDGVLLLPPARKSLLNVLPSSSPPSPTRKAGSGQQQQQQSTCLYFVTDPASGGVDVQYAHIDASGMVCMCRDCKGVYVPLMYELIAHKYGNAPVTTTMPNKNAITTIYGNVPNVRVVNFNNSDYLLKHFDELLAASNHALVLKFDYNQSLRTRSMVYVRHLIERVPVTAAAVSSSSSKISRGGVGGGVGIGSGSGCTPSYIGNANVLIIAREKAVTSDGIFLHVMVGRVSDIGGFTADLRKLMESGTILGGVGGAGAGDSALTKKNAMTTYAPCVVGDEFSIPGAYATYYYLPTHFADVCKKHEFQGDIRYFRTPVIGIASAHLYQRLVVTTAVEMTGTFVETHIVKLTRTELGPSPRAFSTPTPPTRRPVAFEASAISAGAAAAPVTISKSRGLSSYQVAVQTIRNLVESENNELGDGVLSLGEVLVPYGHLVLPMFLHLGDARAARDAHQRKKALKDSGAARVMALMTLFFVRENLYIYSTFSGRSLVAPEVAKKRTELALSIEREVSMNHSMYWVMRAGAESVCVHRRQEKIPTCVLFSFSDSILDDVFGLVDR